MKELYIYSILVLYKYRICIVFIIYFKIIEVILIDYSEFAEDYRIIFRYYRENNAGTIRKLYADNTPPKYRKQTYIPRLPT